MSPFARELFARLLAASSVGRTDEELDALVRYAVRAEAACEREAKRYREAHPTPRPVPTGVPR